MKICVSQFADRRNRVLSNPIITSAASLAGFVVYFLTVRTLQGNLYELRSVELLSVVTLVWLLFPAVTAVLAALEWSWGFRVAPLVGLSCALVWPWWKEGPVLVGGALEYNWMPFIVLVSVLIEGLGRFPKRVKRLVSQSAWRAALVAGVLHFVIGYGLQLYARQGTSGGIILGYPIAALGLAVTGTLPVVLWARARLLAPAVAAVGWLLWGLYETWQVRDALPWGAFSTAVFSRLPPSPDYMLKWTMLLLGLLVLAAGELLLRRARRRIGNDDINPAN